ncbi:hypothetical protein F2P81_023702 [Scophthalmus maximus]|uniref:Uncharacterized protein n=1 Tax=Scophthalmus maximus TaxID=52904 RepID=A0A6A4RVH1_SCOMX|nr:hypothetical protein F2P81_023702 [Scophthalmus maximus]
MNEGSTVSPFQKLCKIAQQATNFDSKSRLHLQSLEEYRSPPGLHDAKCSLDDGSLSGSWVYTDEQLKTFPYPVRDVDIVQIQQPSRCDFIRSENPVLNPSEEDKQQQLIMNTDNVTVTDPHQPTPTSMSDSRHCAVTVVVLARSTPNTLDPHQIQTHLFMFHATEECAASIQQAALRALWQSVMLQFCAAL